MRDEGWIGSGRTCYVEVVETGKDDEADDADDADANWFV